MWLKEFWQMSLFGKSRQLSYRDNSFNGIIVSVELFPEFLNRIPTLLR